jgi:hypothetical protein
LKILADLKWSADWTLGNTALYSQLNQILSDVKDVFFRPSKKEIEEFDVVSYWAKLEQKYFGKIRPKINRLEADDDDQSSPPLSPVISQTFDVSRLKDNVINHKTSTPMTLVEKIATVKRNCANARRALQMIEDEEIDSDQQNKKKELDRSRQTNSQFKDDSSFMEAVMASSFGENSDSKKAKNQTKQNTSQFQVL